MCKKNNNFKKQNGITLIALIITIIIMLILVTVTITLAINGGLFGYAKKAGEEFKIQMAKEQEYADFQEEMTIDELIEEFESKVLERTLDGAMWLGSNFPEGTTITNVITSDSNVAQVLQLPDGTYSVKCNKQEGTASVTVVSDSKTLELKIESTAKIVYPSNGGTNTSNTTITGATTGYGANNPIIPLGFCAINTKDAKWIDENGNNVVSSNVDKGLTIMDANGNQFVWVPITVVKNGSNADTLTDQTCTISAMTRTDWSTSNGETSAPNSKWIEPYTSGYDGEATDNYNMLKSIYTYEGFYIGRFETGTTIRRNKTSNINTTTVIVQQDAFPYNYVAWGSDMNEYEQKINYTSEGNTYNMGNGAVYLSKNMYKNASDQNPTYGIKSTLVFGSQWDAILKWVNDNDHKVWNSTNWGSYKDNTFTVTRGAKGTTLKPVGKSYNKTSITAGTLLTTGATEEFKTKNIYDIAGNCLEWTMEGYSSSTRKYRAYRSGSCGYNGSEIPAAYRATGDITSFLNNGSFRISLYL